MNVIKTAIDGVVIIEPKLFKDTRGYFFESFSQREFEKKVRKINFVQDNESMSSYGVMRDLHFQRPPFTQSKLVRCVKGKVLDIASHVVRLFEISIRNGWIMLLMVTINHIIQKCIENKMDYENIFKTYYNK
jgi:dTDP-4-dehydrorhamnose 3,5-epimerase